MPIAVRVADCFPEHVAKQSYGASFTTLAEASVAVLNERRGRGASRPLRRRRRAETPEAQLRAQARQCAWRRSWAWTIHNPSPNFVTRGILVAFLHLPIHPFTYLQPAGVPAQSALASFGGGSWTMRLTYYCKSAY